MALVQIDALTLMRGALPPLCIVCGAATSEHIERQFVKETHFIVGTHRASWREKVRVPVCRKHRHHWRNHLILVVGGFFLGFLVVFPIALFGAIAILDPGGKPGEHRDRIVGWVCAGSLFSYFVPWFAFSMYRLYSHVVRTAKIDANGITLDNVSEKFAAALAKTSG